MRTGKAAEGKETVETQSGSPEEAQAARSPRPEKRVQSKNKVSRGQSVLNPSLKRTSLSVRVRELYLLQKRSQHWNYPCWLG